jgi:excisionase family DNA binding protein
MGIRAGDLMTARRVAVQTMRPQKQQKQRPKKKRASPALPDYFNALLYTVEQAAAAMAISVPSLNRLIYSERIRSIKVAGRRCVPVSAMNEYIESQLAAQARPLDTLDRRSRSA